MRIRDLILGVDIFSKNCNIRYKTVKKVVAAQGVGYQGKLL